MKKVILWTILILQIFSLSIFIGNFLPSASFLTNVFPFIRGTELLATLIFLVALPLSFIVLVWLILSGINYQNNKKLKFCLMIVSVLFIMMVGIVCYSPALNSPVTCGDC